MHFLVMYIQISIWRPLHWEKRSILAAHSIRLWDVFCYVLFRYYFFLVPRGQIVSFCNNKTKTLSKKQQHKEKFKELHENKMEQVLCTVVYTRGLKVNNHDPLQRQRFDQS